MNRWGDDVDDSDDEVPPAQGLLMKSNPSGGTSGSSDIPPTHKSKVDSKGIQIVTSYRAHPSHSDQLIKTTTRIRVAYVTVREHKDVAIRRKWKKFGQAALDEDQSNITIQSRDDIVMEDPNADTDLQDEDPSKALTGNLNAFWAKQQRRQLERKYDVDNDGDVGGGSGAGDDHHHHNIDSSSTTAATGIASSKSSNVNTQATTGWTQVPTSNKYIPPSQRAAKGTSTGGAAGGGSMGVGGSSSSSSNRMDDLNTIRVTNISENTTEADLQELFQRFGRISRVYLAKDKETLMSRGFAFVSFVHKGDAAKAMEHLQGFGYDHLILKLEWARPNAPKDPGAATEYRSGYGKALAQDTKEKVSFASNLTK
jgi:translation initiation factor 3 subunit G